MLDFETEILPTLLKDDPISFKNILFKLSDNQNDSTNDKTLDISNITLILWNTAIFELKAFQCFNVFCQYQLQNNTYIADGKQRDFPHFGDLTHGNKNSVFHLPAEEIRDWLLACQEYWVPNYFTFDLNKKTQGLEKTIENFQYIQHRDNSFIISAWCIAGWITRDDAQLAYDLLYKKRITRDYISKPHVDTMTVIDAFLLRQSLTSHQKNTHKSL